MDLSGSIYGKLTVLRDSGEKYKSFKLWVCVCECGNEKLVNTNALNSGNTKSCGCARTPIKLAKGESGLRELYRSYKRDAHKRNYEFVISLEEFKSTVIQPCTYCGLELGQIKFPRTKPVNPAWTFGAFEYTGLDRRDNNIGYVISNIVSCCRTCNVAKASMSIEDFLNWVRRVYEFTNKASNSDEA